VGKERFIAQSPSGHMVALDSDRSTNGAPGPMELLLIALGACTATDMVSILAKKRQKLDSLEVEVSGMRSEEPPRV
jgi:putative redox protein